MPNDAMVECAWYLVAEVLIPLDDDAEDQRQALVDFTLDRGLPYPTFEEQNLDD